MRDLSRGIFPPPVLRSEANTRNDEGKLMTERQSFEYPYLQASEYLHADCPLCKGYGPVRYVDITDEDARGLVRAAYEIMTAPHLQIWGRLARVRVIVALWSHLTWFDGHPFPVADVSINELWSTTLVKRRRIHKILRELVENGTLTIVRHERGRANQYAFSWHVPHGWGKR